jgi:DNA topoisomerase I
MVSKEKSDGEKTAKPKTTRKSATAVKGKPLVIVESRAKAKTVGRYLGRNYNVKACLGHVRDLPKTSLGIDLDNNFTPNYVNNSERREIIDDIKKAAKTASQILLATDPDREGEAIAWHLNHILKRPDVTSRVEFNEITKGAVKEAMAHPREIDTERVNAQQARRILDRLVGYNLSPYLWRELQSGLSAGRVQSVATKLICDREAEIEAFKPVEYWTIDGSFRKLEPVFDQTTTFMARLAKIDDGQAEIPDQTQTENLLREMSEQEYKIGNVTVKSIQKRALPPFITSTLQQEASKRLGFSAKRTMAIAQQLYEGIDIGEGGEEGLITYMRTDSVRLSEEAVMATREFIRETYGPEYVPEAPVYYKSKRKVQDAHEAIRPTVPHQTPDAIERHLSPEQAKLYRLIWERFVACQMVPGRDEQTQIEVVGGRFMFRASHTKKVFDGHRRVYAAAPNGDEDGATLPPLESGEAVKVEEFTPEQHFTKPPPRYNTASLVKTLEELGIGRPSTYAPTISTIVDRGYITREGQSFKPTELGRKVNQLLVDKFADIIDSGFTARMEDNLDMIQSGEKDWVESIREFYEPFRADLKKALDMVCPKCGGEIAIRNGRFGAFFACTHYPECDWRSSISPKATNEEPEQLDEECPLCQQKLVVKHGRYGKFIACVGFPKCRFTRSTVDGADTKTASPDGTTEEGTQAKREVVYSEKPCPKCEGKMVLRRSKNGRFWGCEKYPECEGVRPFTVGVPCPREGCNGEYVERRSKRGKVFYGCSNYPECNETTWTYPGKKAGEPVKVATDSETEDRGEADTSAVENSEATD